jgi:hypothetical protein
MCTAFFIRFAACRRVHSGLANGFIQSPLFTLPDLVGGWELLPERFPAKDALMYVKNALLLSSTGQLLSALSLLLLA